METIRELHRFGILSVRALSAIVGCTDYRVRKVILGMKKPTARGTLNPQHIPWLGYALSTRTLNPTTLRYMIKAGTSLSTIADLTRISEATLYRWRNQ